MDFLDSFILFFTNIANFKIFDNVTILELLIYFVFVSSIIKILKIAIKGKN